MALLPLVALSGCDFATFNGLVFEIAHDVFVQISVTNPTPREGQPTTFRIAVTNDGPLNAVDLEGTTEIPEAMAFLTHTTAHGSYTPASGVWQIDSIPSGESVELLITAAPDAGTAGEVLTKRASVRAPMPGAPNDPNEANNTATFSIIVGPPSGGGPPLNEADVFATSSFSPTAVEESETTTLTVSINNVGPEAASGVAAALSFDTGLQVEDVGVSVGTYNEASGTWTIGTLNSGAWAVLTMTVRAQFSSGIREVTSVVSSTSPADPNSLNNSTQASVRVGQTAGIFSSDWSTAIGTSEAALRDTNNDGWDVTICRHSLLEVIPPSALPAAFGDAPPSTTTGNVLRTAYSNDGSCGNVEVYLDGPGELPPGEDYWVRYYIRVDEGVHSRGVAHYETVSVFDYRNLTFNSPLADGLGNQWSPVPRMEGSADYPFTRWEGGYDASGNRTLLLDDGAWYRLEFHVEFLADSRDPGPTGGNHLGSHGSWASENADCEFRMWPRVYDADGNLILDASNYGQLDFGVANVSPIGATWTLQDFYDAGFTYLCTDRQLGSGLLSMQYLGIGNNGATQGGAPASNGSQYFYYMNFAVSTAGWIGS